MTRISNTSTDRVEPKANIVLDNLTIYGSPPAAPEFVSAVTALAKAAEANAIAIQKTAELMRETTPRPFLFPTVEIRQTPPRQLGRDTNDFDRIRSENETVLRAGG